MKTAASRIVFALLAGVALMAWTDGLAQTNPPRLEVSAYVYSSPDFTSPNFALPGAQGGQREFRVAVTVTNRGTGEIYFQNIKGAFGPPRGGAMTQTVTGNKTNMTVRPGEGQVYTFETDGYTRDLLADSGGGPLLFQLIFFDEQTN